MVEMTRRIVDATNSRYRENKVRWDENTKNIVSVAEQLQDVGIKALTIHGRTRAPGYTR